MKRGVTVGQHKIRVHVIPNSKKFEIVGWDHWRDSLVIRVKNKPEGGKANKELVNQLKSMFGVNVKIVSGDKSRDKEIMFECDEGHFNSVLDRLKSYEKK